LKFNPLTAIKLPSGDSGLEREVDVDRGDDTNRVAVEERWLIGPLIDCLHSGSDQQGVSGDKLKILHVTIEPDGGFEADSALNTGFAGHRRVIGRDLGKDICLLHVASDSNGWELGIDPCGCIAKHTGFIGVFMNLYHPQLLDLVPQGGGHVQVGRCAAEKSSFGMVLDVPGEQGETAGPGGIPTFLLIEMKELSCIAGVIRVGFLGGFEGGTVKHFNRTVLSDCAYLSCRGENGECQKNDAEFHLRFQMH